MPSASRVIGEATNQAGDNALAGVARRWPYRVNVECQGIAVEVLANREKVRDAIAEQLAGFAASDATATCRCTVECLGDGNYRLDGDIDETVEGAWGRVQHFLREQLVSHWMASLSGRLWLHASGVCDAAGATLIVGPPGSGKSAFAAACVEQGLRYLGDDALPVDCRAGTVWPVPFAPALRPGYDWWMTHGEFLAQERTYRLSVLRRALNESVPVRRLVLPTYDPQATHPRMERLTTIGAAAGVLPRILNGARFRRPAPIEELIDWIGRTPDVFTARYADVEPLAAMLAKPISGESAASL